MSKKHILEYRNKIRCYFISMRICRDLFNNCFISLDAYIKIEKRLAEKYDLAEDSLFRKPTYWKDMPQKYKNLYNTVKQKYKEYGINEKAKEYT